MISSSFCLCRQIIVLGFFSRTTYLWKILLVSKIEYSLCHRFISRLSDGHPSTEILLSTAVAAFSRGYAVSLNALRSVVRSLTSSSTCRHKSCSPRVVILVEVLPCTTLLLLGRTVEVIKHQVHVCSLLNLQVVNNCFIPMHLYFYVRLCLAGKSAGLMEVIVWAPWRLLLGYDWRVKCIFSCNCFAPIQVVPVSLLLGLLIVTNIECLPTGVCCTSALVLSHVTHKATPLIVRVLHGHLLARCRRASPLVLTLYPSVRIESLSTSSWVTVVCGRTSSMIVKVVRCDSHLDITICFRICIDSSSFISIAI